MPPPTATWLENQSADVRVELNNLIAYQVEPEFVRLLAELLPVVRRAGR